jgi:chemosensory pili system protein ChpA (sensor histidine kinase/response regulator)
MTRPVDPEVLSGFLEEARSYLPVIRHGIDAYQADPAQTEALADAHRQAHNIKGAASMVGLAGLSHIAFHLEHALDDVANGGLRLDDETARLLRDTVARIEAYLDASAGGTPPDESFMEELPRAYARLRGGPTADETQPDLHLATPTAETQVDVDLEMEAPEPETVEIGSSEAPIPSGPVASEEPAQEATEPTAAAAPAEPDFGPDEVSPELAEVFALEADEHLRTMSSLLPALERQPADKDLLQQIRRSAHTLKGAAAMVGFRNITQLAHRMEDLLDALYEGRGEITAERIKLLFAATDALEDMAAGRCDRAAAQALYGRFQDVLAELPAGPAPAAPEAAGNPDEGVAALAALATQLAQRPPAEEPQDDANAAATLPDAPLPAGQPGGAFVRVPLERLDALVKLVSELVIARTSFEQRMADYVRQVEELQLSTERLRRAASRLEGEYEASTLGCGRTALPGAAGTDRFRAAFTTHGFDELEFDRYTGFHLLTRELAETSTDIHTVANELRTLGGDFDGYLNRQARLSSEVQDKLRRIRMVPLATAASRLHRTVRNVAGQQGKEVNLILDGEATELDKTVLEEMVDPLMHLLRNAVDHGIEPPDLRRVQGKPERGTVRLRAYYEGTQVVLQVADDGAGLDPELLRAAAVKGGFATAAEAAALGDADLYGLIFQPGFSTARAVSEVSGRGVGLDIVKAQVHKLKGSLAVDAQPGRGTTFTIRLPLTLAITRALLVKAHNQVYALPLADVRQILRLDRDEFERVGQQPVVRMAGKVYPVVSLARALGLDALADESLRRPPALLLDAGGRQVALVVDQLLGGREIVVKTLGTHLRQLRGVTGATLLGDGRVVLILNPADLFGGTAAAPARPVVRPTARARNNALNVLVVDDSPSVRRILTNLLRNTGWQTAAAKDGLDALEILNQAEAPPDLIVLDVEMPRMDGYELLATLKGQRAYRHIPVLMVTSRAGEKHRRKALDLGASGYLVKPYQDETLLRTIRELVGRASQVVQA